MRSCHVPLDQRRGAVAPLFLILLIPLLAMVAFSVDTGYICLVKAELQNAADAAALAGASQLLVPDFPGIELSSAPSNAVADARNEAKRYAKYNYGGNVALDLLDSDIDVSYQSAYGTSIVPESPSASYPNTVQVTLRRDKTANKPLSLFFAPVLGVSEWNGTATATAMVRNKLQNITGFESWPGGPNATLLPITVNVNTWNNFLKTGISPDGKRYDDFKVRVPLNTSDWNSNVSPSGTSDGTPEVKGVYPDRTTPGNWGLIRLDPTASPSADNAERWVLKGPTPAELSKFGPDGMQATASKPLTVPAGPGLKSSLVPDFEAIIGQPRSIPLYTTYSDKGGSNTTYEIVGFAGVVVVNAVGRGNSIEITFQPAIVVDATATPGSSEPNVSSFIYADSPIVLTK